MRGSRFSSFSLKVAALGLCSLALAAGPPMVENYLTPEENAFSAASQLLRDPHADKDNVLKAFQKFIRDFGSSPRVPDALFTMGEIQFDSGVSILSSDAALAKDPSAPPVPRAAAKRFSLAESSYQDALRKAGGSSLRSTLLHRLGELYFDQREWAKAAEQFDAAAATPGQDYVKPLSLIGSARTRLAQGNFDAAGKALAALQRDYPEYAQDPLVLSAQGAISLHAGRYAEAEKALKGLDSPRALYDLGRTYLYWNKPLLAASAFKKLMDGNPPANLREPSRFLLGDAYFLSKDYDGAIDKYRDLLRDSPNSKFKAAALYRIGSAYFERGDYTQAREAFEIVISKGGDPAYARLARYFIAESHLAGGMKRVAENAYEDLAADGSPDIQPLALYKLLWIQESVGETKLALKTAQKFLQLYPTAPAAKNVYLILANIQVELKDYQNAVVNFQRILDLAPKSEVAEQALFSMLKVQYDLKNYSFILTSYQYLLTRLSPTPSKWKSFSYLIVADVYLRLGRVRDARPLYEMLLKGYADGAARVYAQDGLAWCDELEGHEAKAMLDRQKIAGMISLLSSSSTLANLNGLGLADSFYGQKDYTDAYELYAQFAKEHADLPAAPAALYRAGDCLYHQKHYSEAIETWRGLVAASPYAPEAKKASLMIADTLFRSAKYADAQTAYKAILTSDPHGEQTPMAILRLSQLSYYLKDNAQALAQAQDLITRYPSAPETNDALDLVETIFDAYPAKDFKDFIHALIVAAPNSAAAAQAQFRLGRDLFDKKNYADAVPELQRFNVDYPASPLLPRAQLYLGQTYSLMENYDKAVPVLERFMGSYSSAAEAPEVLFLLGGAYTGLKKYEKAAAPYQQLLKNYPGSKYADLARFNLAVSYQQAGDLEKAADAYDQYVASAQGEQALPALWALYDIRQKQGSYPGAIKVLKRILSAVKAKGNDALEAAYRMGEMQKAMGDEKQACKTWEVLRRLKPASNAFRLQGLVQLSKIYEKDSDFQKAYAVYKDLAKSSTDPSVVEAVKARMKELAPAQKKPGNISDEEDP
jgi:TolA-binding protein